jgi:hypothetical protein
VAVTTAGALDLNPLTETSEGNFTCDQVVEVHDGPDVEDDRSVFSAPTGHRRYQPCAAS